MLVYGRNVCLEFLKKNKKVRKIILQEGFHDENLILAIGNLKIQPKYLPKSELDRLANGLHQGIIMDVEDFRYTDYHDFIDSDEACVVILDHLEDPHNLGAIIRTSEAAGISGIIIPKDRSVEVNATVLKTSVGAVENIPVSMVTNLNSTIKDLKDNGFWIVGTDMTDSVSYTELDYNIPIALIIGNEGFGISRLVREKCDYVVNIPMKGKINSLNASVASGILIYKIIEKRN
jgi:23S rRNA (guanosine2251-2'-O)-methyltransferase